MKVNMTPNPLDVVTIHASQGDTEARQWEFELHNNGELIDTSDVKEQLVFKAYKGGTEQLLPENGSVPITAPFLGDIKYPQGLLTDQEFTYRESPTTKDGYAKITSLKGNTLVWNQMVNVNVASNFITFSDSIIKLTGTPTGTINLMSNTITHDSTHKYLFLQETLANPNNITFSLGMSSGFPWVSDVGTVGSHSSIYQSNYNTRLGLYNIANKDLTGIEMTCSIFDLSRIFGIGNEPATIEEFTSLFALPYYGYNTGTLLSFNGTGIKTRGKNLLNLDIADGTYLGLNITKTYGKLSVKGTTSGSGRITFVNTPFYLPSDCIFSSNISAGLFEYQFRRGGRNIVTLPIGKTVVVPKGWYDTFGLYVAVNTNYDYEFEFQVELGNTVTPFEPYTTQTTNLPISTYFPTGMKSAGNVYDELTESKATTRIGAVDLGSLTWTKVGAISMFYAPYNTDGIFHDGNDLPNIECANYSICSANTMYTNRNGIVTDDVITVNTPFLSSTEQRIVIADTSFTDATAFKTAMSGVYLYYELKTPTETEFTTASLVTENAEIPLSNDDGTLIGKCTEELSAEPGFHDAKIKLSDSDGECYSNKIQLHIERSPQ